MIDLEAMRKTITTNDWWFLESGDMQNIAEQLLDEIEQLRAQLAAAVNEKKKAERWRSMHLNECPVEQVRRATFEATREACERFMDPRCNYNFSCPHEGKACPTLKLRALKLSDIEGNNGP